MNFSESLALKAVSLLLALILWITIIGFKREEAQIQIQFEPTVAPDMVIANKLPNFIEFRISGPRLGLLRLKETLPQVLRPDWKHLGAPSFHEIPLSSDELLGKLKDGVRVLSVYPAKVYIRVDPAIERDIPVRLALKGNPAPGYEIVAKKITPPSLKLSGPGPLMKSLSTIETVPIDVEGINETKEFEAQVDLTTTLGQVTALESSTVQVKLTVRKTGK